MRIHHLLIGVTLALMLVYSGVANAQSGNNSVFRKVVVVPQSYHGRQCKLCNACKGSKKCDLCNGTGVYTWTWTDLNGVQRVGRDNCVCVDINKHPGKCLSCNGYGFVVKYGDVWLAPDDKRVANPPNGSQKVCTFCNATGFVPEGQKQYCNDCFYNSDLSWHQRLCSVCKKVHCYLIDKHDLCPYCNGVGRVTD